MALKEAEVSKLAGALRVNKGLLTLNLCACGFDESEMILLARGLKENSTLRHLDVSGNRLFVTDFHAVGSALTLGSISVHSSSRAGSGGMAEVL